MKLSKEEYKCPHYHGEKIDCSICVNDDINSAILEHTPTFVPSPTWEREEAEKFYQFTTPFRAGTVATFDAQIADYWISRLREAREEEREAHPTEDGWCCACDYDRQILNTKLEEATWNMHTTEQVSTLERESYMRGRSAALEEVKGIIEKMDKTEHAIHGPMISSVDLLQALEVKQ